jgi:hypothetical protein
VLGFRRAAIDEIGALGVLRIADPDSDQMEAGRAHLTRKQVTARGENADGDLQGGAVRAHNNCADSCLASHKN